MPKPLTSNSKAEGRFDKRDFIYDAARDEYRCPRGRAGHVSGGSPLSRLVSPCVSTGRQPVRAVPCVASAQRASRQSATGARASAGAVQARTRPNARSSTAAPADCRASLRNAEVVDGRYALPNKDAAESSNRDEFACPRLQPEASDQHPWSETTHRGDAVLIQPCPHRHRLDRCVGRQRTACARCPSFSHALGQQQKSANGRKRTPAERRLAALGRRLLRLLPLELQIKSLSVPFMDHGGNVLERRFVFEHATGNLRKRNVNIEHGIAKDADGLASVGASSTRSVP